VITNGLGQKVQFAQYNDPTHVNPGDPADVTTYTYTHASQLASITDATGHNTWTTTYDLLGRTASATDPDTGITSYTYDNDGRMLTSTDASSRTLAYTYDNLGRKTAEYQTTTSGTKLASWTYDTLLKDKPTSSSRYANGRTYTNTVISYDTAGRVTSSRFTIPLAETGFGGNYSFSWRYDPLSDVLRSFGSPATGGLDDESMITGYDALDNPITLQDAGPDGTLLVSETDYNPYGQVLRNNYQDPTLPNQVSVTHTYADGTNRLATTLAERATSTNYVIGNRTYTYDPAGDTTTIADTPQDAPADTQCFSYDYLQRLTQAFTPGSGNCAATPTVAGLGGAAPYWTSWTYDQTGNRRTQTQHTAAGDTTAVSTYPAAGQAQPHAIQTLDTTGPGGSTQSSYTYDPAGRALTQGPAGAGLTFTYDAEGRVATATDASGKVSSYTYDADGNLLLTKDPTGTTLTLNDLELFRATGSSSTVGTRFYTFNDHPVAERNAGTGLFWMLTDAQDTTYATVDAANLAVTQRWQDPYGVARGPAPTGWPDSRGYLGGYQNSSGLTHLGARDYDPVTGRFTTVDPLLDTTDPQQMNGYTYAGDNPILFSDPSGLCHGPDGSCPLPGGGYGGGDACRNGGWSCGDTNPNVCGCTNAPGGSGGSSASDVQLTEDNHPPASHRPAPPNHASPPADDVPTGADDLRLYGPGDGSCGEAVFFCIAYDLTLKPFVDCAGHLGFNWDCGTAVLSVVPEVGRAAGAGAEVLRSLSAARTAGDAEEAGVGADNAVNGLRLAQELARESASSAFTASGELKPEVIAGSRQIIAGSELKNPGVVATLTSDGSKIADWGKYSTRTIQSPAGNFQVHFYMNRTTGAVNYSYDYKVKFAGRSGR
jgi:RHS repeat-associated protein